MGAIYERMERVMESKGISAYRIAKDTGISRQSFVFWKNGDFEPKADKVKVIADYLGVSLGYLLFGLQDEDEINAEHPRIPLLGVVPCGVPIDAIEEIVDYIDVKPNMAKGYFGLKAKGNSMIPEIKENDTLIVRQTSYVENGKIGIVKIGNDDATCKKIFINENGITLVSINNAFDPIFIGKDKVEKMPVYIIGQVVEIRREI